MFLNNRLKTYAHLSTKLACLSNVRLTELIHEAPPLHTGIGGKSALLTMDDTKVFVKKIPLTDLERQPQNFMSTANLFELPLFYQYGVGSAGFGAWRELVAHIMATNWVLALECPNFPLMYHWRVLPLSESESMNTQESNSIERDVQYWENSPAIHNRLKAIHCASAHIILFLEYVPQTLYQWLGAKLKKGRNVAKPAISFVDKILVETNNFMLSQGFIHFDAHFENILTDGKLVYISDFGLALSSKFDLTKPEMTFFHTHCHYDRCATIVNLLHCIITNLFDKDHWELRLKEFLNDTERPPPFMPLIRGYAPIALMMDEFYQKLQKESKSTPYPATQLNRLLGEFDYE